MKFPEKLMKTVFKDVLDDIGSKGFEEKVLKNSKGIIKNILGDENVKLEKKAQESLTKDLKSNFFGAKDNLTDAARLKKFYVDTVSEVTKDKPQNVAREMNNIINSDLKAAQQTEKAASKQKIKIDKSTEKEIQDAIREAQSGNNKVGPVKNEIDTEKALNKPWKNFASSDEYSIAKQQHEINTETEELLKGFQNPTDKFYEKVSKFSGEKVEDIQNASDDMISNLIETKKKEKLESITPRFRDKMTYNRIPQKIGAVGVPLWLVSNMNDSRGQQTNGQLYGQQSPYN